MSKVTPSMKNVIKMKSLLLIAAVGASSCTHAQELLNCMTLSKKEKYSLMAMNLEKSIKSSSLDTIREDAVRLFDYTKNELIYLDSPTCQKRLNELNFSSIQLTNLTNEELHALYRRSISTNNIDASCKELVKMLFVPAFVSSIAANSSNDRQIRIEMSEVLQLHK